MAARGLTYIHGFDDPAVIAGQGTIGLELLEQAKSMIEVNVLEYPRYHIADNKLG